MGREAIDLSDASDRVWTRMKVGTPEECWPFLGSPAGGGYGQIKINGKSWSLHRVVYGIAFGEIPETLVIDHICHNLDRDCLGGECPHRLCCNPQHLEAVTNRENLNRSRHHVGARTHCPQGHEYTPENTMITSRGDRICKICNRNHAKKWRQGKINTRST